MAITDRVKSVIRAAVAEDVAVNAGEGIPTVVQPPTVIPPPVVPVPPVTAVPVPPVTTVPAPNIDPVPPTVEEYAYVMFKDKKH